MVCKTKHQTYPHDNPQLLIKTKEEFLKKNPTGMERSVAVWYFFSLLFLNAPSTGDYDEACRCVTTHLHRETPVLAALENAISTSTKC